MDSPAETCNGEGDWYRPLRRRMQQQLSKMASAGEAIDDRRRRLLLLLPQVVAGDSDLGSGIVELCIGTVWVVTMACSLSHHLCILCRKNLVTLTFITWPTIQDISPWTTASCKSHSIDHSGRKLSYFY